MAKLRFGTGGVPNSTQPPTIEAGIKRINELGLDCMELEFVRNVTVSASKAPHIKNLAKTEDVVLTVHASYFINLASHEEKKLEASIQRILNSARIGHLCCARSVTFHAAFYQKKEASTVFENVKSNLVHIVRALKAEDNDIWIRPELTGKQTQFGSLEELIALSSQLEHVLPCIDFAHLHARTGKFNSKPEFQSTLESLEKGLGKDVLRNMHIHMAGIEYGRKGEKKHLNLKESDMDYRSLMEVLKDFRVEGIVICESPNLEVDAMLTKNIYENI